MDINERLSMVGCVRFVSELFAVSGGSVRSPNKLLTCSILQKQVDARAAVAVNSSNTWSATSRPNIDGFTVTLT